MVTTKRDGSKVKEILDPEDPRITEIGVIKKTRPQSGNVDTTGNIRFLNNSEKTSPKNLIYFDTSTVFVIIFISFTIINHSRKRRYDWKFQKHAHHTF